jgi:protein-S-isoprenylcysteine O-methyltransferase Ste14
MPEHATRNTSLWRQLRALLLPLTVDGLVPAWLLVAYPWAPVLPLAARAALALTGLALVAAGLWLLVSTIRLLVVEGQGTLAPWDPTRRLVVQGIYRRVRNPMISGVIAILLGESALFASPALLAWCGLAALVNLIYILRVEEPGLVQRFGAEYDAYRRNVPRWVPRRTP